MLLVRKPGFKYVRRVGVSAWDFQGLDFTPDGTVRKLDVSSIVPANAKMVHCRIQIADGQAGRFFGIADGDETDVYNIAGVVTQVAGIAAENDEHVVPNASGEIGYYLPNEVVDSRVLLIMGWWV